MNVGSLHVNDNQDYEYYMCKFSAWESSAFVTVVCSHVFINGIRWALMLCWRDLCSLSVSAL